MRKNIIQASVVAALLAASMPAAAVSYGAFDPRSLAMGGVGVASGSGGNAGFINPGLLGINQEYDGFTLELPMLYGRAADPDDLITAADDFNTADYVGTFSDALDQLNISVAQVQADSNVINQPGFQTRVEDEKEAVSEASRGLLGGLKSMSGKPIIGEAAAGFVIALPSKTVGLSFQARTRLAGGGIAEYTDEDDTNLNDILNQVDAIDVADDTTYVGIENIADTASTTQLTSNLQTRIAVISEVGISIAREFTVAGHDVSVGITPKYVQINLYHFGFFGNELDQAEIELSDGEKIYTDMNLDFGMAKDFGNGWKMGFAVNNLLSKEYETQPNSVQMASETVSIGPQARLGVAHSNEWVTVAVDADLNAADPIGYEAETQYVGIGAELDIFDTLQLRLGYRSNLKDADTSVPTVGLGLSPFGLHIDIAVSGNENELSAAGQLGFRF